MSGLSAFSMNKKVALRLPKLKKVRNKTRPTNKTQFFCNTLKGTYRFLYQELLALYFNILGSFNTARKKLKIVKIKKGKL